MTGTADQPASLAVGAVREGLQRLLRSSPVGRLARAAGEAERARCYCPQVDQRSPVGEGPC